MRCILCEDTDTLNAAKCPCLSEDNEYGGDCNLGYTIESAFFKPNNRFLYYSTDCKLKSINHADSVFTPQWVDREPEPLPEPNPLSDLYHKAWISTAEEDSRKSSIFEMIKGGQWPVVITDALRGKQTD
jgi:hypothetical protein